MQANAILKKSGRIMNDTKDYIIDKGVDGRYRYEKWASGIYKCWLMDELAVTGTSTSAIGPFFFSIADITVPDELISVEAIHSHAYLGTGSGFVGRLYPAINNHKIQLGVVGNANSRSAHIVSLEIIGLWKTSGGGKLKSIARKIKNFVKGVALCNITIPSIEYLKRYTNTSCRTGLLKNMKTIQCITSNMQTESSKSEAIRILHLRQIIEALSLHCLLKLLMQITMLTLQRVMMDIYYHVQLVHSIRLLGLNREPQNKLRFAQEQVINIASILHTLSKVNTNSNTLVRGCY